MKNLYGTIGYTILTNPTTSNKIIVFADRHDNLPKCNNLTNISDWFEGKMHSSKILLEEVPRDSVNLEEIWTDSEHTQDLKNLFLANPDTVDGIDIRPLLIPFSWELVSDTEPAHLITARDYLQRINIFFTLGNEYMKSNLANYNLDSLINSKLGKHYLILKTHWKKLLENYREFLQLGIWTIKIIRPDFLENINLILDQILEWYICAKISSLSNKSIIVHTGLAHSEKIIDWLQTHYQYQKLIEKGINQLAQTSTREIYGCMGITSETDVQFGGFVCKFNKFNPPR
jgi:hypothetical protein